MYEIGEMVILNYEEGLDIPEKYMDEVGKIIEIVNNEGYQSYNVEMADGEVVYCEEYHIRKLDPILDQDRYDEMSMLDRLADSSEADEQD